MSRYIVLLNALAELTGARTHGGNPEVSGIAIDSRRATPGDLFFAIPGARHDGSEFIPEAIRRGAVAVCAVAPVSGIPTLVCPEPRRALADVSAAFYGFPARDLALIGITGSLGKTSTALFLEAALGSSRSVGVIGSLGIRMDGRVSPTGMTTPEAPAIHAALREMADSGIHTAIIEVTSHAILHQRVAGLTFSAGIITNLVPDEHLEFHPTPEHYVQTKTRFFDMLLPSAPLVYNSGDDTLRNVVSHLPRPLISVAAQGEICDVEVVVDEADMKFSAFTLRINRPLPLLSGATLDPGALPVDFFPVLGQQQITNAAMALTTAIVAGADPPAAAAALANVEPIRRRMEVLQRLPLTILDDTVGNPASINAVFETLRALPHSPTRVVYAIRGSRGIAINVANAKALAAGVAGRNAELTITSSEDAADERNRVTKAEQEAVLGALRQEETPFHFEATLEQAVKRTLRRAVLGDTVLLLGAQGMDRGAAIARDVLGASEDAKL